MKFNNKYRFQAEQKDARLLNMKNSKFIVLEYLLLLRGKEGNIAAKFSEFICINDIEFHKDSLSPKG